MFYLENVANLIYIFPLFLKIIQRKKTREREKKFLQVVYSINTFVTSVGTYIFLLSDKARKLHADEFKPFCKLKLENFFVFCSRDFFFLEVFNIEQRRQFLLKKEYL